MYGKLLVPIDGSPTSEVAVPYARRLAQRFGATVELLCAIDSHDIPEQIRWDIRQETGEYLEDVAGKFPGGVTVTCTVKSGMPAELIVDLAAAEPDTLIVMSTHGYTGVKRWLVGSVAWKVAQAAQNPILLVRPAADGSEVEVDDVLRRAIVPLDGSELAEQVLPHVEALHRRVGTEIELVRIYNPEFPGVTVRMKAVAEIVKDSAVQYLDRKRGELTSAGLQNVSCRAVKGRPAGEIIDLADDSANSIIAMCTHGRTGVGRWLLGSVTSAVLHHTQHALLIVRADTATD